MLAILLYVYKWTTSAADLRGLATRVRYTRSLQLPDHLLKLYQVSHLNYVTGFRSNILTGLLPSLLLRFANSHSFTSI